MSDESLFTNHHITGVWRPHTIWPVVTLTTETLWPRCVQTFIAHKFSRITQKTEIFFLKAICGNSDPRKCPDLWGTFSYMPARAHGECGIKNGSWCLSGKDLAGSPGNDYYALCAVVGELPDFDSIPSNWYFSVAHQPVWILASKDDLTFQWSLLVPFDERGTSDFILWAQNLSHLVLVAHTTKSTYFIWPDKYFGCDVLSCKILFYNDSKLKSWRGRKSCFIHENPFCSLSKTFAASTTRLHSVAGYNIYKVLDSCKEHL